MKIPDFITVKASASLHQDRVVLLVEVKRNDETLVAAQEKLAEYFEAFIDKTRADGTPLRLVTHLEGLLVAGNQAVMATWSSGEDIQWSELVDMTGVEVDNYLKQITIADWYLLYVWSFKLYIVCSQQSFSSAYHRQCIHIHWQRCCHSHYVIYTRIWGGENGSRDLAL